MRHKLYTSINVLGLAIGLACGILILLYIQQEFAVDRSHTLGDRIYKVIREQRGSTQTTYEEGTSGALGPVVKETFPEVETTVRIWQLIVSAQYGERKGRYSFALIDDNFLDVFDFPLIKGDSETVFRLPYSAVITDDMAQHLFGDTDPMGQTVSVDNRIFPGEYTVTGIVKAPQRSSDLHFHLLTTIPSVGKTQVQWIMWLPRQSWRPVKTYVLLKTGQNAETLQTKMQPLIKQYMGDEVAAKNTYHLQSLHRVYLYGESDFNPAANSPIQHIYILTAIGLIVVVIACVNFTNLATARAITRKREVGVRKVVGAHRPQLMIQFLTESLLLTSVALLIALALVELSLPLFNQFVYGNLHLNAATVRTYAPAVLALTLVVGLLAGWYPAFFLSSFSPVTVLKSSASSSPGSTGLKKGLVIFQFGMSILLVICTLVVYQQLQFIETKNMGFARDHIVSVPIFVHDREHEFDPQMRLSARHQTVKQVFLEHPNILSASALRYDISGYGGRPRLIWPDGDRTKERTIRINEVDDSFFEIFDIPVLRGRAFSADVASDTSQAIILNETAVRLLGWEDDPIGKQIETPAAFNNQTLTVIGVVKDYHSLSLREEIAPMGFVARWRTILFTGPAHPTRKHHANPVLSRNTVETLCARRTLSIYVFGRDHTTVLFQRTAHWQNARRVLITRNFYSLFGTVRTGRIYGSVSHQRNWRAKSTGRIHISSGDATLPRIYIPRSARQSHRLANRLLSHARLALRVCLPDRFKCLALCRKRDNGPDHRLWNREHASHSRCAIQPD